VGNFEFLSLVALVLVGILPFGKMVDLLMDIGLLDRMVSHRRCYLVYGTLVGNVWLGREMLVWFDHEDHSLNLLNCRYIN
jgi:hypothetical protein